MWPMSQNQKLPTLTMTAGWARASWPAGNRTAAASAISDTPAAARAAAKRMAPPRMRVRFRSGMIRAVQASGFTRWVEKMQEAVRPRLPLAPSALAADQKEVAPLIVDVAC